MGIFELILFAGGNRNKNKFEINGETGSIRWDMERMNELDVYFTESPEGLQGFRTIHCTEEQHPYAGAYWPPGHSIGYEQGCDHSPACAPNLSRDLCQLFTSAAILKDGVMNQRVMESIENSARNKGWGKPQILEILFPVMVHLVCLFLDVFRILPLDCILLWIYIVTNARVINEGVTTTCRSFNLLTEPLKF